MLATLGFVTIAVFLLLTMTRKVSVLVALVAVPVVPALLGGFAGELGTLAEQGLVKVAPVAIMITFAVLYFTLVTDAGMFDPVIRAVLRAGKGDPQKIALGTAVLTLCVALDGEGASTFLICVSALLPLYKRLGMSPLVLSGIVALGAGVMNMVPWGGPTARAMAALELSSDQVFTPVLPSMLAGIAWVLVAAWLLGRKERRRLGIIDLDALPAQDRDALVGTSGTHVDLVGADGAAAAGGPWRRDAGYFAPGVLLSRQTANVTLTAVLLVALVLTLMPLPVLFVFAYVMALLVNAPTWEQQQAHIARHGGSVALVTTMIFAAGIFTGILTGTEMITRMAEAFASVVPQGAGPLLAPVLAVIGMPLSLVFTPDAFYFGVLPVFGETAAALGVDPALMGRAAILGQMTTGFPLSPLTASTFILIGLSGVELGAHAKHIFTYAFMTTLVMTAVGLATGALL